MSFISQYIPQAGLFSATVTAFIIEGYKKLNPDSGDQTVVLLKFIAQQMADPQNRTTTVKMPDVDTVVPPGNSTLIYSAFWFASLVLTLTCALGAVLVKQWARLYRQDKEHYSQATEKAQMRQFLRAGVEDSHFDAVVYGLPAILQIAVLLFFAGLAEWLFTINMDVFWVVIAILIWLVAIYIFITIKPCITINSLYNTFMTGTCFRGIQVLRKLVLKTRFMEDRTQAPSLSVVRVSVARREAMVA